MTEKDNSNNSLIPITPNGLVRVGNSIDITKKIISEHEERSVSENFKSVKIGNQYWMTENLDVDCYLNGDSIPQIQNSKDWEDLQTGAWCYYDNDSENGKKFGKIYNWFAINDKRGLAPKGFKVASFEDWKSLFENLGEDVEYKLKSNHGWEDGNGNNESKLNIYPGGFRMYRGIFIGKDKYTYIWTSTEENENSAVFLNFNNYSDDDVFSFHKFKYLGLYVRCLKI